MSSQYTPEIFKLHVLCTKREVYSFYGIEGGNNLNRKVAG